MANTGFTIWFTGLSGAGKSFVEKGSELFKRGLKAGALDRGPGKVTELQL